MLYKLNNMNINNFAQDKKKSFKTPDNRKMGLMGVKKTFKIFTENL